MDKRTHILGTVSIVQASADPLPIESSAGFNADSVEVVSRDSSRISTPPEKSIQEASQSSQNQAAGPSSHLLERPEILYCLRLNEEGKASRSYFRDHAWKGIKNGFLGSGADEDPEADAVLIYTIPADVTFLSQKNGNTASTWRDEPSDFELRQDANLITRYWPKLTLCSKRLTRTMELLMHYYPPHLGSYNFYESGVEDTFVELMYYYAELKAYFGMYLQFVPDDKRSASNLDIGSCGDELIAEALKEQLDFGSLDVERNVCDFHTAQDLAVLLRTLAPMYRIKVIPTLSSVLLHSEPRIDYGSVWVLLKPGTYVYVQESAFSNSIRNRNKRDRDPYDGKKEDEPPDDNELVACVVSSWQYKERSNESHMTFDESLDRLLIELWYVEYDGGSFHRKHRQAILFRFEGFRPIRGLEIIPASLHDKLDGGALRARLEKRGRRYLSILREPVAYREYDDPSSGYNGQIIVDPDAYTHYAYDDRYYSRITPPKNSPIADGDGGARFLGLLDFQPSTSQEFKRICEVYILLPRRIHGLGLKTKNWMVFEIDHISDSPPVPTPNQLTNELVLSSDEDLDVLCTVLPIGERPISNCLDFVTGKGEGKIFLLYGPPGTGKTLTVECVANDTRRPLIAITPQDILVKTWRNDTESQLRKWFTVAAKWDAILLIDEADIFLEQRREGDSDQNGLATIFLRSMEYYKGVLFLTTNRPGHIDDSFISRITCPIAYKPLTASAKSKILKKFIRKFEATGTVEVEASAEKYVIENCGELNGRQIRNIIQTAAISAESEQRTVNERFYQQNGDTPYAVQVKRFHVKAAVERQVDFLSYLKSLKGGKDEPSRARSRRDYLSSA